MKKMIGVVIFIVLFGSVSLAASETVLNSDRHLSPESFLESKATNFTAYYSEFKEDFGEEYAENFKKNAKYFIGIVAEGREDYILRYLKAVFYNPGKESTFKRFVKKLEKHLRPGAVIDQARLTEMSAILAKEGEILDIQIEELNVSIAAKEKINNDLERKIQKSNKRIADLAERKEKLANDKEKLAKLEEELKMLKQKVKEWGGTIEALNQKFK
ncbi:hypothetical protein KAI46_03370 [bacterium]|nr:hypothetical protein [bacterium]